jgi:hypothetical protein
VTQGRTQLLIAIGLSMANPGRAGFTLSAFTSFSQAGGLLPTDDAQRI